MVTIDQITAKINAILGDGSGTLAKNSHKELELMIKDYLQQLKDADSAITGDSNTTIDEIDQMLVDIISQLEKKYRVGVIGNWAEMNDVQNNGKYGVYSVNGVAVYDMSGNFLGTCSDGGETQIEMIPNAVNGNILSTASFRDVAGSEIFQVSAYVDLQHNVSPAVEDTDGFDIKAVLFTWISYGDGKTTADFLNDLSTNKFDKSKVDLDPNLSANANDRVPAQSAIRAYIVNQLAASLVSPAFTGNPTVPTQTAGNNSTRIANTAFVQAAIAALVASSPATLDTLNELATALGNDPNFATSMAAALGLKAPSASPTFTGTPTAPTAATVTNNTQVATTAFVQAVCALITKSSLGLGSVPNVDATNPANIVQTLNYRFVTDAEKATWNAKQAALGFTPENSTNKNAANGYVGLDANSQMLNSQIKTDLKACTGVQYNGSNNYHTVAENTNIQNDSFSIEWFGYISNNNRNETFIEKRNSINTIIEIYQLTGVVYFKLKGSTNGAETYQALLASGFVPNWYHFLITYDANLGKMVSYVNGRKISDINYVLSGTLTTTNSGLLIGKGGDGFSNSNCSIARYFNYVLSSTEAAQLWNGGKPNQYLLPYSMLNANNTVLYPTNCGGLGTTDFIDTNGDGIADGLNTPSNSNWTCSIVTGNGFTGNAQRFVRTAGASYPILGIPNSTYQIGKKYIMRFKYRASGSPYVTMFNNPLGSFTLPTNTGNAVYIDYPFIAVAPLLNNLNFVLNFDGDFVEFDDISIYCFGATLSLEAKNCYSDKWLSNSNNYVALPTNNPIVLTSDNYAAESRVEEYSFITNIASGTANKDLTLPAGYFVDSVQIGNANSGSLTNVQCVLDPTGLNTTLFSAKTVTTGAQLIVKSIADHQASTASKVLRFNATGNSVGMSIIVNIKRQA